MSWPSMTSRHPSPRVVGLFAGAGELPALVAAGAQALGCRVITAALLGETSARLAPASHVCVELALGQLGSVLALFQEHHVTEMVMAGAFSKRNLFGRFKPDLTMLALLARLGGQLQDDRALRELARVFEKAGMVVMPVPPYIAGHMAHEGVMTLKAPTADEMRDVAYGMRVARTNGLLDVGQTVVVRRGTVLAVEAVEGTNAAIERGAALGSQGTAFGKGGVVVCKVVKPHQDLRLDLPTVGTQTVEMCVRHGVRVLAVDAPHTIMVDKPATLAAANRAKLVMLGVKVLVS